MPIKAKLRKSGFYYLRGTHLGVRVDRSSGTRSAEHAKILAAKEEREIFERYVKGPKAVATFAEAAADYLRAGGEGRYMTALITEFGMMKLCDIDQSMLDAVAIKLMPDAKPATRRRVVHVPFIATWNQAVAAGKAEPRRWQRPAESKLGNRWEMRSQVVSRARHDPNYCFA